MTLMRSWLRWVFLAVPVAAIAAPRKPLDPCLEFVRDLTGDGVPSLARHVEHATDKAGVLSLARLKSAARVIRPGASSSRTLAKLPNDMYVFVIDRSGATVVLPRRLMPTADDPTFLGVHPGAYAVLEDALGYKPDLVGAGEITVRDGWTVLLTNKSGHFRGDQKHLDHSRDVLGSLGLVESPHLQTVDVSKTDVPRTHMAETKQVEGEIASLKVPAFVPTLAETRAIMRSMRGRHEAVTEALYAMAKESDDFDTPLTGAYFMSRWLNEPAGSDLYLVQSFIDSRGAEFFGRMLNDLKRAVARAK